MRLHLANGFRVVGVRERIGRLHGAWCDVVLLERRSRVVGRVFKPALIAHGHAAIDDPRCFSTSPTRKAVQ